MVNVLICSIPLEPPIPLLLFPCPVRYLAEDSLFKDRPVGVCMGVVLGR